MATIQFYHLTATPMERAVPKLLDKAYSAGFRTHLVALDETQVDYLNQSLWTSPQDSFLPHACAKDAKAEKAAVYLSDNFAPAPNRANVLFITQGGVPDKVDGFERIIDMFDGNDAQAVSEARKRWKEYQSQGHDLSYYKQTEEGGWAKA